MEEGGQDETQEKSLMVSSGFSERELPGKIYRIGIPHTRLATDASKSGSETELLSKS
jgi:hypothetical protein